LAPGVPMRDLPPGDRPRERLLRLGPQALSDAELIAILIGSGVRGESAVQVGQRLLRLGAAEAGHGLRFLSGATAADLTRRIRGLGPARAAVLLAAVELGRRVAEVQVDLPAIHGPADVARLLMPRTRGLDREQFFSVLLNTRHQVLGIELVAVGSLNAALVHPREIFKTAIRRSAHAIIVAHNHPSGDPTPSAEDRNLTRRLVQAGRLLGIAVLDHVILGDHRHISLRECEELWE